MRRTLLVLALFILVVPRANAEERPPAKTGTAVASFTLKDGYDKTWSLDSVPTSKAVVVAFLGIECPVNTGYLPRLAELHSSYASKGVTFVGINSNWQDSALKVRGHAESAKIPFPVLKDPANTIADVFSARRTPEVFVLDGERRIVYQGRIDDQIGIGYKKTEVGKTELADAIEAVLAGKKPAVAITSPPGCLIARVVAPKADAKVTYTKHVASILQKNCQECHRPGQIGPFPLLTYEDAVNWAEMIGEVVSTTRMPPWHADPKHGTFSNDRRMSDADKKTVLDWIEQGRAKGDVKDMPVAREYLDGWRIGKPDQVFEMAREFKVPATAKEGVKYQNYVVPTNFTEDRWIVAAEARPGNRAVVHHILVLIRVPGAAKMPTLNSSDSGLLTGYVPGDVPLILGPGQAKKIPAGAVLVFQMHYTPNGTEQSDRSSCGIIFAKEPPKEEVKVRAIAKEWLLVIPPEKKDHLETTSGIFSRDKDVLIYSLTPHMHLRGKAFTYEAHYPDKTSEILLSVPNYDFGWQTTYIFKEPKRLPAGTRVECRAVFDNSAENFNNPNPKRTVYWGEQTWQEMLIGFANYHFVESDGGKK